MWENGFNLKGVTVLMTPNVVKCDSIMHWFSALGYGVLPYPLKSVIIIPRCDCVLP